MLESNFGMPINADASAVLFVGPCEVIGFYVNSTNVGTIVIHDSESTGTNNAITGTITPAIGWREFPAALSAGLRAVIGGTALNVTFFIKPIG